MQANQIDEHERPEHRAMLKPRWIVGGSLVIVLLVVSVAGWLHATTADREALEQEEKAMIDASLRGVGIEPGESRVSSEVVACDPPLFGRTKFMVKVTSRPAVPRDRARPLLDRFASFWGATQTGVLADVHIVDVGMTRGDPSVFAASPNFELNAFDHAFDGLEVAAYSGCGAL